jgi:hypothetical protein
MKLVVKYDHGRMSLSTNGNTVNFQHLSGIAPKPSILPAIVKKLGEELVYKRSGRKCPFRIDCRVGMSGCVEYWVEYWVTQKDGECYPKRSPWLHISSNGKLNRPTRLWYGDLIEIIECFEKHTHYFDDAPRVEFEDVETLPKDLIYPKPEEKPDDLDEDDDEIPVRRRRVIKRRATIPAARGYNFFKDALEELRRTRGDGVDNGMTYSDGVWVVEQRALPQFGAGGSHYAFEETEKALLAGGMTPEEVKSELANL